MDYLIMLDYYFSIWLPTKALVPIKVETIIIESWREGVDGLTEMKGSTKIDVFGVFLSLIANPSLFHYTRAQ
jgi:hypothetical protein